MAPEENPLTTIRPYTTAQVTPLRVNAVGLPLFPVWLAWKPMLTEPFAAMVAL